MTFTVSSPAVPKIESIDSARPYQSYQDSEVRRDCVAYPGSETAVLRLDHDLSDPEAQFVGADKEFCPERLAPRRSDQGHDASSIRTIVRQHIVYA
jgi:hypothetical protein